MADLRFTRVSSSMDYNAYYAAVSNNFSRYCGILKETARLSSTQKPRIEPVIENSKDSPIGEEGRVMTPLENSDEKLEKLVSDYLLLLNGCHSYEQLCDVVELVKAEDYRPKALLLRIIACLVRDCHELVLMIREDSDSDQSEYEKLLDWERFKIERLSLSLDEKEEIIDRKEERRHKLIISHSLSDNSPVYDELDALDSNYYSMFAHLLELIETHGTDTRCKYICRLPHFKTIGCLYEAKSPAGGRVIFRALDNDNILILSAFIKKCTSSKAYIESMNSLAEYCSNIECDLKKLLNNPDFILQNNSKVEEIWSLLKPTQDLGEEKPPVYTNTKGGGINAKES